MRCLLFLPPFALPLAHRAPQCNLAQAAGGDNREERGAVLVSQVLTQLLSLRRPPLLISLECLSVDFFFYYFAWQVMLQLSLRMFKAHGFYYFSEGYRPVVFIWGGAGVYNTDLFWGLVNKPRVQQPWWNPCPVPFSIFCSVLPAPTVHFVFLSLLFLVHLFWFGSKKIEKLTNLDWYLLLYTGLWRDTLSVEL